jgi:hypothetical protein
VQIYLGAPVEFGSWKGFFCFFFINRSIVDVRVFLSLYVLLCLSLLFLVVEINACAQFAIIFEVSIRTQFFNEIFLPYPIKITMFECVDGG